MMMNMKILKVEYGDLYHTNKSNFYMERTIIYVFGPKRLQDNYQNGKNLQKDFTGWLKIGQTSTTEDQEDKWDAAMKRVKQEQRTGICEPSILFDVFEYGLLRGNDPYSASDDTFVFADYNIDYLRRLARIESNEELRYECYTFKGLWSQTNCKK